MSERRIRELEKLVAAEDKVIAAQAEKIAALERLVDIEREVHRAKTRAGQANARVDGKALGRRRSEVSIRAILALRAKGLKVRAIAKELGISPATVSRRLTEHSRRRVQ